MDPLEYWSDPSILNEPKTILDGSGKIELIPSYIDSIQSKILFSVLNEKTCWSQDKIKMYGKDVLIPRKNAWYADSGLSYTYSQLTLSTNPWYDELFELKSKIESYTKESFNSVLMNLYSGGQDSVAWHSDDEPELGANPTIVSLSLGATRLFTLRNKNDKSQKIPIHLQDGDLLVMTGDVQHKWEHQIPKTSKNVLPRINLTFRKILP